MASSGKSKLISRTRDEFGERISTKAKDKMAGAAPRANGYDASFEGKRDRWNGYDAREYQRVMQKYEHGFSSGPPPSCAARPAAG